MKTQNEKINGLLSFDHWFKCNLECLLGSEIALIIAGKKKEINIKMLADWIAKINSQIQIQ